MPNLGLRPERRAGKVLSGLALGVAVALGSQPVARATESGTIRIDGQFVDEGRIDEALVACARRQPELEPARCIDRYFVPLWLLDREANARHLEQAPGAQLDAARALTAALGRDLRREVGAPSAEQLARFRSEHVREFERPERIRIFRILVQERAAAAEILRSLGKDTKPDDFRKLARERSIDGATKERGGDLGFVWPDGTTDVPELRADPALYAAAEKAQDGEIVPVPVAEGTSFAVIWRRGTLAASTTDAAEATRLLTERWIERAVETRIEELLQKGKARMSVNEQPLKLLARPENRLFATTAGK